MYKIGMRLRILKNTDDFKKGDILEIGSMETSNFAYHGYWLGFKGWHNNKPNWSLQLGKHCEIMRKNYPKEDV